MLQSCKQGYLLEKPKKLLHGCYRFKRDFTLWKNNHCNEIVELESLAGEMDIVDKFKYLGVSIDNRLNFHSHIASIQKRSAKFNGLVYKARYCFSRKLS